MSLSVRQERAAWPGKSADTNRLAADLAASSLATVAAIGFAYLTLGVPNP